MSSKFLQFLAKCLSEIILSTVKALVLLEIVLLTINTLIYSIPKIKMYQTNRMPLCCVRTYKFITSCSLSTASVVFPFPAMKITKITKLATDCNESFPSPDKGVILFKYLV